MLVKVNMSFIDAFGHDWHLEHRQIKGNQRGQVLTGSKLVANEIVLIRKFSAVIE